jgi:uncharacterized repeat protein (TIGR02543 family)
MQKISNQGIRFIVGILSITVSAVVVGSMIASALNTLALAIRDSNETPIVSSSQTTSSSSSVTVSSSIESTISSSSVPVSSSTPSSESSSSTPSSSSSSSISSSSETSSSEPVPLQEYTVEFNSNGGLPSLLDPVFILEGTTIPFFPTVTLTNHTFLGWFTGTTPNDVLFDATMPVVRDMVLYAWWQTNPDPLAPPPGAVTFVVAFDARGGLPIDSVQVEAGKSIALPTTTRSGYVFLGWFTGDLPGDVLFTAQTSVTRDMVLYARWERQSFMITFLTYGGSSIDPIILKADEPIILPPSPSRLNRGFGGWYTDAAYTTLFALEIMPETSLTLHAYWEDVTYEGLITIEVDQEIIITGYDGIHTTIHIPSFINDLPVTTIADFAFEGNSNLALISLPDEGGELTTIGRGAFMNMRSLRSVNIPATVTSIGADAFRNSTSLQALHIPKEVTSLGENLLTGALGLRTLSFSPENNSDLTPTFPIHYLFGGQSFLNDVVPSSLRTITITEGTLTVPNDGLRSLPFVHHVYLPSTVTTVGTNVVTGANNLRHLAWKFTSGTDAAVNSFLGYAFGNTHGLVTQIPTTLTSVTILENTALTRLASRAFYNITNLTSIELPDNIIDISSEVFAHVTINTSRLEAIDLPSQLQTIGASAFVNNSALKELVLPDTLTSIGTNVLGGTTQLHTLSVSYQSLNVKFLRYLYGGTSATAGGTAPLPALKNVEITGTTTTITTDFFRSNSDIQTISLPETTTSLGNTVFFGMTSLKTLGTTGSVLEANKVILPSAINSIGTSIFEGATNIEFVSLPETVTVIPASTFSGTTALRSVVVSSSLTEIQLSAFLNSGITTITLPETLTTLGNTVFSGSQLETLVIPNSVTTIGTSLLLNTTKLTDLSFNMNSLPVSTTLRVFRYFYGGTSFSAGGTPPTNLFALTTVNITQGTIVNANFFNGLAAPIKMVTLSEGFTTIQDLGFANVATLEEVRLPSTLVTIGTSAFQTTPRLTTLTLPEGLTTIGISAFQASGITYVQIPSTVTTIGNNAFAGATFLTLIEFMGELPPTTFGTTVFGVTAGSATQSSILLIELPFGATAAYTNTATNPNYSQFATLLASAQLVEAEGPEVILP